MGVRPRGAGPSCGRPRVASDRARDHDPCRPVGGRRGTATDLRRGRSRPGASRHRPCRLVPASRALPVDRRARSERRVRLPRHVVHAGRAAREGRIVELLCELLGRGHVERILLSQDVCHDSQLARYGGNGYTYLARTFLPRLREAGVSDAEIDTMTVDQPAPAADDRLGRTLERRVDAERDIAGQRLADRAAVLGRFGFCDEVSLDMPGTTPRTVRWLDTMRQPASSFSNVTSADTDRRSGGAPARPRRPEKAIAKHEAWAAATSSSGLVLPPGASVRAAQLTGRSAKAPLETALTVRCRWQGRRTSRPRRVGWWTCGLLSSCVACSNGRTDGADGPSGVASRAVPCSPGPVGTVGWAGP